MRSALAAHRLSYTLGSSRIVEDVTLQIEEGELVAIVGPNGAGKTTLLRLLAGELEASSGHVELRGRPLSSLGTREVALERAVMPQHTNLQFAFTVEAVVEMGRHPHRSSKAADAIAVAHAMHDAGITDLAHRSYPTLSGGERQRVTFGRVLAQQTPLLLLDEPTSSLDLHHQEHLMTLARQAADRGGTVIIVLHDLNLAAGYADRICLLDQGRLVAAGPPADVFSSAPLDLVFGHPLAVRTDPATGLPIVTPIREVQGRGGQTRTRREVPVA